MYQTVREEMLILTMNTWSSLEDAGWGEAPCAQTFSMLALKTLLWPFSK